jgi:hypothetical protein
MTAAWDFTADGLRAMGFEGFVRFEELPGAGVPEAPGVYVVLRTGGASPVFREANTAGWFKGKDPAVALERLASKWVPGAGVLYIGKASKRKGGRAALRTRLDEYRRHGEGEPVGHWGGRLIWQLADCDDLRVAWRASDTDDAEELEADLLSAFVERYGALPFANLKRGARRWV